jgi:hypothetical protein
MPDWRSLGPSDVRRDSEGNMYYMAFDESMGLNLEQALCREIGNYESSVREHINCDLKSETGCKVSGPNTDCAEDMMFLYGELAKLHKLLYNMREARLDQQKDWATSTFEKIKQPSLLGLDGEKAVGKAAVNPHGLDVHSGTLNDFEEGEDGGPSDGDGK